MADPAPRYTVAIDELSAALQAGETLAAALTIKNEGDDPGEDEEATVELLVEDESVDSTDVSIPAGEEETTELEWTAPPDAVGEVTVAVETPDEEVSDSVTVEDAPASFAVELDASEFVSPGGRVTGTATITNEGTLPGTQQVRGFLDDEQIDTRSVDLDGQDSAELTLTYDVPDDATADLTLRVESDDDEATEDIELVAVSVTPSRGIGSKSGMGVFGWLMFIGMIVLLVPLLPVIALIKLFDIITKRSQSIR